MDCFFHCVVLPLSMKTPWKPKRLEKQSTFYVHEPTFQQTQSFPLPSPTPYRKTRICAPMHSHLLRTDILTPILEFPTTSNESLTCI